jgi:Flp pilus assembly protein TadG
LLSRASAARERRYHRLRKYAKWRDGERGDAMVVWCLLVALLLLPLAGLSVDLWHGIEVQRQLQSAADDAASAGASGIDVALYRKDGCVSLDPAAAVTLAQSNLQSQAGLGPLSQVSIDVTPGGKEITVELTEQVHLTLLSLMEQGPLVVRAVASSEPLGSDPADPCHEAP